MRISDWSSDVGSSDLACGHKQDGCSRSNRNALDIREFTATFDQRVEAGTHPIAVKAERLVVECPARCATGLDLCPVAAANLLFQSVEFCTADAVPVGCVVAGIAGFRQRQRRRSRSKSDCNTLDVGVTPAAARRCVNASTHPIAESAIAFAAKDLAGNTRHLYLFPCTTNSALFHALTGRAWRAFPGNTRNTP